MKFVISTSDLQSVLARLQNVVSQKPAIPILSNILIETAGDEIIITATDLTVGMRCYIPAKVLEEGATTLPAKRLAQLTRELNAPHLEVTTGDNDITEVIANTSRFKLHGMSKKEFPSLPDISSANKFNVPQKKLKDVLFRTSFAVSREDNRYVLTGVFMHIENDQAMFVGTDGKRLAKTFLSIPNESDLSGSFIIPLKAVEEIQKTLHDDGEAIVYILPDKIAVESGGAMIITKLLTGDYPDVNRVIPASSETQVNLHREELITLLRQISLFTSETDQSVRFSFGDGELRLSADSIDIGEGHVSMPVNFSSDPLEIAFNPNYFLDILRHSKQETVQIGLSDSFNPGVITEFDEEEEESNTNMKPLFVLMPMRLSGKS